MTAARPRATFVAFAAAAAFSIAVSGARTILAAEPTEAEILFREARKLARAGDWKDACPKFAESERLDPAPGTLLNLADCEEHFGSLVSAREHFSLAASGFPLGDEGRAVALGRVAVLDKRIAHVTLRLAADVPPSAVVKKANVIVDPATLGQPVSTDPGMLDVVVSLTGHADRKYSLNVPEGGTVEQELQVGEVLATQPAVGTTVPAVEGGSRETGPAPGPPPPPTNHTALGLGIASLGVGAISLGVGAVTGILSLSDASTAKRDCDPTLRTCSEPGHNAAVSSGTLATVSTITLIAGGALAALGGSLLLFGPKGTESTTATAVIPFVSPTEAGAILRRTF
jgi:hypothetical protein